MFESIRAGQVLTVMLFNSGTLRCTDTVVRYYANDILIIESHACKFSVVTDGNVVAKRRRSKPKNHDQFEILSEQKVPSLTAHLHNINPSV